MQQRASLCRALIHDPNLLLLDEPFGALDQFTREELWGILQTLWIDTKPTVLLVTHDLRESAFLANRIVVMSARPGRILVDEPVGFARPRSIDTTFEPGFTNLTHKLRTLIVEARSAAEPPHDQTEPGKLASAALIVGVFVVWELACLALRHQRVRPAPAKPDRHGADRPLAGPDAACRPDALHHACRLRARRFGGILIGMLIGSSRLAYNVAFPLLVGFSSIPKVAVVPIFVLWFGAGTVPAILTSMIISVFPVVVNMATGLATTEPELEDVLRTLKATKRDILLNVGLPRAMPYLFASLKVAVTLSFVGTVISETVASNRGIGNMMLIASSNFNVPLVFAGLFILAGLGIALYVIFSAIERRVTGWANRKTEFAMG